MLNLQNINAAIKKLDGYDPVTFLNADNSYTQFVNRITIEDFRHIHNLDISFDHPITIITGTNKIGKTSILLLIACSHHAFNRYDSTKPDSILREHTWRDVLSFTSYENRTRDYSYKLYWRVGIENRNGEAKRLSTSQAWTGVGKASSDLKRMNAKIRNREVRLIDLERVLPARNFSHSLLRKISTSTQMRLLPEIEQAFSYILDTPNVEIHQIGAHVNKIAFLINYQSEPYSSYNAASGEESLINILIDIFTTPNNSLILIDEIEAGLHPSIQRKLADVIQYVSWTHKKQFIITTHSPTLLSAFNQKSRKFIDKNNNGHYETINKISVNGAFSKMDSKAYPLMHCYCEDEVAEYIIKNLLIEINATHKSFDRLTNVIKSGPIDQVKSDYLRHKRNYNQLRLKMGYCCVFDGDYMNHPDYSSYHSNPSEFSFFLYPYIAPEKFLVKSFLQINPNPQLQTSLNYSDHHALFQQIVNLGLATDISQALHLCWDSFKRTSEYQKLTTDFRTFILNTTKHFSLINE